MNPKIFHDVITLACGEIFDRKYSTPPARAQLLTTGLIESEFEARGQIVDVRREWWQQDGPAASYYQIERIGIRGVMEHHNGRKLLQRVCDKLGYPMDLEVLFEAIRYDIILATAIARLILWLHPEPLATADEPRKAYEQYLATWRPGKPKPFDVWATYYWLAWDIVEGRT